MPNPSSQEVSSRDPPAEPPAKKKRNLPGMPDPEAEVIALSPKTLMATNRFVCEICNKGFQRDQNLQLHRRGHNLPWRLRQRDSNAEPPRKKVYVCPEPACVHHNPARALGDLTGIKKHFCRKHGEKKWKCERCAKKYAVQSDWKAHMRTCGTREYKCDCGMLFSRRDSFVTHRAFCDALAEESSRAQNNNSAQDEQNVKSTAAAAASSPPPPPLTPSTTVVSPVLSLQSSDLPENAIELVPSAPASSSLAATVTTGTAAATAPTGLDNGAVTGGSTAFSCIFPASVPPPLQASPSSHSNLVCTVAPPSPSTTEPASLSLFLSSTASSLFSRPDQNQQQLYALPSQPAPAMSATALLQKAAQMGAAATNASLLRGLGLAISSPPASSHEATPVTAGDGSTQWSRHGKVESSSEAAGLGLGLPSQPSLFGNRPMTVDFLGLGMGPAGGRTGGLSALLTSIDGGLSLDHGFSGGVPGVLYGRGGGGGGGAQRVDDLSRGSWEELPESKPDGPNGPNRPPHYL
ncbi:hypothetical protein BT93_F1517 [Corymbia citriodora subsp. variegata]|nr:hypothetical protein BT93_F1517 [Corymbia citriodora subsp. variegata]